MRVRENNQGQSYSINEKGAKPSIVKYSRVSGRRKVANGLYFVAQKATKQQRWLDCEYMVNIKKCTGSNPVGVAKRILDEEVTMLFLEVVPSRILLKTP